MRFSQIEQTAGGKDLVDIDKRTHAVPQQGGGTGLFLGALHLGDVI